MRVRFGRWMSGALAPLAALFAAFVVAEAGADGLAPSATPADALRHCSADQNCVRISGYVAAGSDFTDGGKIGGTSGPLRRRPHPCTRRRAPMRRAARQSFSCR